MAPPARETALHGNTKRVSIIIRYWIITRRSDWALGRRWRGISAAAPTLGASELREAPSELLEMRVSAGGALLGVVRRTTYIQWTATIKSVIFTFKRTALRVYFNKMVGEEEPLLNHGIPIAPTSSISINFHEMKGWVNEVDQQVHHLLFRNKWNLNILFDTELVISLYSSCGSSFFWNSVVMIVGILLLKSGLDHFKTVNLLVDFLVTRNAS